MKNILLALITIISTAAYAEVPAGTYEIDTAHTKVGFEIPHLVISSVEGRFVSFTGDVVIGKKLDNLKVNAEIDAASIDTGNEKRDAHLKSADFFDVAKFPKLTFKSKSVKAKGNDVKITGDLTIHGVTKQVVLEGKYQGNVKDQFGNEKVAFQVGTKINRKDFGLTWGKMIEAGPAVGDEVTITLKVQANKKK